MVILRPFSYFSFFFLYFWGPTLGGGFLFVRFVFEVSGFRGLGFGVSQRDRNPAGKIVRIFSENVPNIFVHLANL